MRTFLRTFVGVIGAMFVSPGVNAQSLSELDTLYLSIDKYEIATHEQDTTLIVNSILVVDIFLSLHTGNLTGATLGITWDKYYTRSSLESDMLISTSDWQFDSLINQGDFANRAFWFTPSVIDVRADSLGAILTGGLSFGGGIPPGSDLLMAKLYLSLRSNNSWGPESQVTLDTTYVPPAGDFLLSFFTGEVVVPTFLEPKTIDYESSPCCITPGDYDNDGSVNLADITAGINRIFTPAALAPVCQDQADFNGDGEFNVTDVALGIANLFSNGGDPVCGLTGK